MDRKEKRFVKDIKQFLLDESGFVNREVIVSIGSKSIVFTGILAMGVNLSLAGNHCSHSSSPNGTVHSNALRGNGLSHVNEVHVHTSSCSY